MYDKTQATYFIKEPQQHVKYGSLDLVFTKKYNDISIWYRGSDIVIYNDGTPRANMELPKSVKNDIARLLRNYSQGNNFDGYQLLGSKILKKFTKDYQLYPMNN